MRRIPGRKLQGYLGIYPLKGKAHVTYLYSIGPPAEVSTHRERWWGSLGTNASNGGLKTPEFSLGGHYLMYIIIIVFLH